MPDPDVTRRDLTFSGRSDVIGKVDLDLTLRIPGAYFAVFVLGWVFGFVAASLAAILRLLQ